MSRGVAAHTRAKMDALADLMAEGAPSVSAAATAMGLNQTTGDRIWQRIRRDLGEQAR